MGDSPPSPPVVTLNCPGIGYINTQATFSAIVTDGNNNPESATIIFYFDGTQVQTSTGTSATYSTSTGVAEQHIIRVTAQNSNGSSEASCNWNVFPQQLIVTLQDPSSSLVLDPPCTQRPFTASTNQPATISFYLDGSQTPIAQSASGVQQATYPASNPPHTIQVVATNNNGNATNCWNWLVIYPIPSVTLVGTVASSNGCQNINETGALIINNVKVQQYSDGSYAIQMDFNIGGGGSFLQDHWDISGSLTLSVTIGWPEIQDPNNPSTNSISQTYLFNSVMENGTIAIPVPLDLYYTINCQLSGTVSGLTYGESGDSDEELGILPWRESITISAQCDFQIVMPT